MSLWHSLQTSRQNNIFGCMTLEYWNVSRYHIWCKILTHWGEQLEQSMKDFLRVKILDNILRGIKRNTSSSLAKWKLRLNFLTIIKILASFHCNFTPAQLWNSRCMHDQNSIWNRAVRGTSNRKCEQYGFLFPHQYFIFWNEFLAVCLY